MFLNIFDPCLVESTDAEPDDTEGWNSLYSNRCTSWKEVFRLTTQIIGPKSALLVWAWSQDAAGRWPGVAYISPQPRPASQCPLALRTQRAGGREPSAPSQLYKKQSLPSKASVSTNKPLLSAPSTLWPVGVPAETHFKAVHEEVVGFPEVLLIVAIVQTLTGGVVSKFPPLPIVHRLTLAPIIPGIVYTLSFFLGQDIIPKLKRQDTFAREHWEGKDSIRYSLENRVGSLNSGFSNCVPWNPWNTFKVILAEVIGRGHLAEVIWQGHWQAQWARLGPLDSL